MNKKKIVVLALAGYFTFNYFYMRKTGMIDRIREMDKKYNGKIPVNSEMFDYIFKGKIAE